ncbi:DUF6615 family protein [Kribbella sp. NPDC056861]|uniref:DUF6615 family protein n=1 Tax=Kribbella sp. NPDC056861 TaxID=3154857 RepID=UPI00342866AC
MSTSLFEFVLNNAAAMTRERIVRDRLLGLDPHEETLTQNLTSQIIGGVAPGSLPVAMKEIDRRSESRLYGADLALWIRGRSGKLAGLHLQAKRQYPDDTYRKLGYKPEKAKRRQIDQLVVGARATGAGAGYIFYNGLTESQPGGSACCLADYSPTRNGVTLTTVHHVERCIDENPRETPRQMIEDDCNPLGCLARCVGQTPPHKEDDLAEAMRSWY